MTADDYTLDVFMYGHGQDYWDGIYDPIESDPIEVRKARVAEANNRREFTRTLKQRLAYLVVKRGLTTSGEDTWKVGSAARSWLVGEHGKSNAEAGRMPMATLVAMLGEVPAATPATGETLKRDLELASTVMDADAIRIFQIARGDGKAENKMSAIVEIDATYWGRNSPQWADLLNVSESAIKKTDFWKIERSKHFADARALWRDRHPDKELPDELKKYDRESQD